MTDRPENIAMAGDGLPPLRDVIEQYDLRAKKSLGQNFLLDLNLTRKIARCGGPVDGARIVEVGPGPGGLTRALLQEGAAQVFAVEKDQRCLAALSEIAKRYPGRLSVIEGDALAIDWPSVIGGSDGAVQIAANLPYSIATELLTGWLETEPWPPWFERMTLMFQSEVADRIVAEPGRKAYGRLSILSQWRCDVRVAMSLPPAAFTPPPKVSSSVVVFKPKAAPTPQCNVRTLARVTAAAFGQRRKMLRTSLKQLCPMPELLLQRADIDPQLRAEQLGVADFARMAAILDGKAE